MLGWQVAVLTREVTRLGLGGCQMGRYLHPHAKIVVYIYVSICIIHICIFTHIHICKIHTVAYMVKVAIPYSLKATSLKQSPAMATVLELHSTDREGMRLPGSRCGVNFWSCPLHDLPQHVVAIPKAGLWAVLMDKFHLYFRCPYQNSSHS